VQSPSVSVIVVSWNAGDVLGACLDSLERQRIEGGFETIVVDSGSTDGTAALLREREGVTVISKEENVGFSAGNNEAAALAAGEVLFFLNSDTELLDPDTLATLARVAREPGVGLVGPRLENPDGTLQPSCAGHLSVGRALLVASGLHLLLPDRARAGLAPDRWSHDAARDTDWLMGAAIAIRAELFREVGGFWPRLYVEDQELALRLQRRGLRVRYEPSVRVMHIGNHSNRRRFSDPERAAVIARAEVAFLDERYSGLRAGAIRAVLTAGHAVRSVVHRLLGRADRALTHRLMARAYARSRAR
jgi:GT2 family glycosyltransferase